MLRIYSLSHNFDAASLKISNVQFVNHVRRTREAHPRKTLIAGNVVTGEMVEELILSGADIVKVRPELIRHLTLVPLFPCIFMNKAPPLFTVTLFYCFLFCCDRSVSDRDPYAPQENRLAWGIPNYPPY